MGGIEIWLVCTPASLWTLTLTVLRPSSSVIVVATSDTVGGLREPMLRLLAATDPFIC